MKVAIIGNGPAGQLAAHACRLENVEPVMYHLGQSPLANIRGAQYIHAEIPDVHIDPFSIRYTKVGDEETYWAKVYGDNGADVPVSGTSWGLFEGVVPALSMWKVVDLLRSVNERDFHQVIKLADEWVVKNLVRRYDVVLNTAPLPSIKPDGEYESQVVYILQDPPETPDLNEIIYFGSTAYKPYRSSNIMGYKFSEYGRYEDLPPMRKRSAFRIEKPLRCAVELPGVHRLGRYGKWTKGQLVHHAFEEAQAILREGRPWNSTLPD